MLVFKRSNIFSFQVYFLKFITSYLNIHIINVKLENKNECIYFSKTLLYFLFQIGGFSRVVFTLSTIRWRGHSFYISKAAFLPSSSSLLCFPFLWKIFLDGFLLPSSLVRCIFNTHPQSYFLG